MSGNIDSKFCANKTFEMQIEFDIFSRAANGCKIIIITSVNVASSFFQGSIKF